MYIVGLVWSAVKPHDYFTWFLEVVPALSGGVVLASTWRKFLLTRLAYVLFLMVDWHYSRGAAIQLDQECFGHAAQQLRQGRSFRSGIRAGKHRP